MTRTQVLTRSERSFGLFSGRRLSFYLIHTLEACIPSQRTAWTAISFFCRSCVVYRVREIDGTLSIGSQAIVPRRKGRASKVMMEDSLLRRWRVFCGFAAMVPIRCINISSSGWTTPDRPAWKRKLSCHSSTHTHSPAIQLPHMGGPAPVSGGQRL